MPSKIYFFLWTCLKGSLLTIGVLQQCGLILLNACPLWLQDEENIKHIFIHYPFASKIWTLFLREIDLSWIFPKGLDMLLLSWEIRKVSRKGRILWSLMCLSACWAIWSERNQRVFEDHSKPAFIVYSKAKHLACFWGLCCNTLGEYSVMHTKEGWGRLYL